MQLSKLLYKNIFWRGLNMASVFVLNVLIAQVFGAANYGSLFYYINTLAFIVLLVGFSLDSSFTFYNAKPATNTTQFIKIAIVWSLCGALLATFFVFFYNKILNDSFSTTNCFMYVGGMLLLTFFTALFNAKHHYFTQNLTIAIANTILAISLLFLKNDFNAFTQLFFLSVLAQGIAIAFSYILKYRQKMPLQNIDKIALKPLLKYASIAFIGNVLFFLTYRVDYWFIDYFVKDKILLGNYIQASKIGQFFIVIPSIVASTIFAVTAEGKKENMGQKTIKLSKILFVSTFILCLPLLIWGKWIFPFLFGKTFTLMYQPFLLLFPGILALTILLPYAALYSGKNKINQKVIGASLSLFILIVFDIFLIPTYNINGAALASSIGYFIYSMYLIYHSKTLNQD